ncbi:MAG: hypothetical protein K0U41_02070 [Gammaproteobacteria bacterium]|nr:hypothetical protein [Gammaproteobacteria bacterium]
MAKPFRERTTIVMDAGRLVAIPPCKPNADTYTRLVSVWFSALGLFHKHYEKNPLSSGADEMLDAFTLFTNNANKLDLPKELEEEACQFWVGCDLWVEGINEITNSRTSLLLGSAFEGDNDAT